MKKQIFSVLLIVAAVFVFNACSKDKLTLDVPYSAPDVSFSLDSATTQPAKGEKLIKSYTFKLNIDSLLDANNAGEVKKIKANKTALTLILPADATYDFSFLQSARISLKKGTETSINLASLNPFTAGSLVQNLTVADIDLIKKLDGQDVTIEVYADVVKPVPATKVDLKLAIKYLLTVGLK